MTDVLIHSPYPFGGSQGNAVSALRLEAILREAGYPVAMEAESYGGGEAGILVALNARRSAVAVAEFSEQNPGSVVVIVLTGTDINHAEVGVEGSPTWRSMERADCLVALHEVSVGLVPERFRDKVRVIYPGVCLPEGLMHERQNGGDFTIVMAGNMRAEKNPGLALALAERLPAGMVLDVYGEFTTGAVGRMVNRGVVSHAAMLRAMARADVLLNTSFQEGAANAVCEAVRMGLPVVASGVSGNVGVLGEDYAGLFASDDADGALEVLVRAAGDGGFYGLLKSQVEQRGELFDDAREGEHWRELVAALLN